ncbi:MAG: PQQ-like beta-propeller repeat protein, partial [Planctomycetaceae bacterium]|nr:PQQ-like beta-propeller repeat protein [Planctomycetaceae bacterium]
FPRHRSDAPEIDSLVTGTADEASFRRLYASQLQKHGDSVAAFVQLLRLGEVTRSGSEMEAIDAEHSVGRDRWIEARVHELLASASVADREAMLNGLRDRLHAVVDAADDDARLRALQGLVRMARGTPLEVDALTALARSAEGLPLLQQSWLWQSIQAVGDESLQAEAVARLAQLTMRSHDPVSAVPYVDLLRTTYAEVPCLDQQTGRQLLDDWSRDAQFEEALSEATASAWPGRDVAITNRPFDDQIPRVHVLPVIGEIEGPLAGWSFTYDDRQHRLYAHNPLGRIAWEVSLSTESASERSIPTGVMAVGHLVMVRWENRFQLVAALTSEGGRYRTVSGGRSLISQMYQTQPFAGRRLHDSTGRAVGLVGPLTSEVVCYGVDESLVGLDPWTGREVWRRAYAGGINAIFGDDDYVVIRPNGQGELIVLRAVDGSLVARRPWPADFLSPPVGADWGRLLPTLKSINDSSDRLAMYDSATGETLWERQCSSPIHWSTVDGGSILLVDGKFQCVLLDPSTGQEQFSVPLPIEPPEDDRWDSLTVASDRDRVYVVMNRPQDSRVLRFERQATGDRPVNGRLCAVNRATGKLAWHADVDGQYIDPNHPDAWPVLILAARQRAADAEGFEFVEHILDKQTGELIHESQMPDEALGNRWVAQVRWRVAGEPPVIRMIHGPQTLEIAPGTDKESDQ